MSHSCYYLHHVTDGNKYKLVCLDPTERLFSCSFRSVWRWVYRYCIPWVALLASLFNRSFLYLSNICIYIYSGWINQIGFGSGSGSSYPFKDVINLQKRGFFDIYYLVYMPLGREHVCLCNSIHFHKKNVYHEDETQKNICIETIHAVFGSWLLWPYFPVV